jgi:hypothetical protein
MVIERPNPTAISDLALFIDDVNALRPRGIGVIGDIVHIIHAEGNWEVKALDEIVGNGHALLRAMRLRVADILIHIRFHLPLVERMRFANIYGEEIRAILVIGIQVDEVAYLAAKRRSRVAAEHQNQRALANAVAQMKSRMPVERQ